MLLLHIVPQPAPVILLLVAAALSITSVPIIPKCHSFQLPSPTSSSSLLSINQSGAHLNEKHTPRKLLQNTSTVQSSKLGAAPKEALSDIVIPGIFGSYTKEGIAKDENDEDEEDPRIWVPQTECLSFRPLCFCVSQGYYVNLLKFKGGGTLGRHRHSSPVHALTLKGSWGYKEHDWHATAGTYVFEPPGETHTLVVDEDCDEMVAMFHVTGSLLYVDEDSDNIVGFDDVFSKLEKAKEWYKACGLGEDYVQQFVR